MHMHFVHNSFIIKSIKVALLQIMSLKDRYLQLKPFQCRCSLIGDNVQDVSNALKIHVGRK